MLQKLRALSPFPLFHYSGRVQTFSLQRELYRECCPLIRLIFSIDGPTMRLDNSLGPEEAKSTAILFRRMEKIVDAVDGGLDPRSLV